MPVKLKKKLKDEDDIKGQGRLYNPDLAASQPGAIRLDEVILGMRLAIAATTDDKEGTLKTIGARNPWHIHALELITGSVENAFKPLSQILPDHLGFKLDRAFSYTKLTGSLHAVDTQGFIASNEKDVALAYRPSIGGFDWLTNFTASTSEFEPDVDDKKGHSGFLSCCSGRFSGSTRIHTGFYNAFLVSVKDVQEVLEPHVKGTDPKRFIVCGYSLGAAVATVAFIYLLLKYDWESSPHKLELVTAGCPRVCDDQLAREVRMVMRKLRPLDKCSISRLVREQDVVPTVPLKMMGFQHLDKLVYLTDDGSLYVNPAVERLMIDQEREDEKTSAKSFADRMRDVSGEAICMSEKLFDHEEYAKLLSLIPGPFKDHMPDLYLDPLMQLLSKTAPLQLEIVRATALRNADPIGTSDPYVVCKIPGKTWSVRTKSVRGNLNPEWRFSTVITAHEEEDSLEFEVWDQNTLRPDKLLGRATLENKRFRTYPFSGDLELVDTRKVTESASEPPLLTIRVFR